MSKWTAADFKDDNKSKVSSGSAWTAADFEDKPVFPVAPKTTTNNNFVGPQTLPEQYKVTKTPYDPVIAGGIGMNIIQPYKEDNPLVALGKGVINYGLGTVGRIAQAPVDALSWAARAAGQAVTGQQVEAPRSGYDFIEDIMPQQWAEGLNRYEQQNPFLGGAAKFAIRAGADPTTWVGGGIVDDLAKAGMVGKGATLGTAENLAANAARGKRAYDSLKSALQKSPEELAQSAEKITLEKAVRPSTGQGKYNIVNRELNQAWDDYDAAIERIQNQYGTNELRANELAQVKPELDSIISRIEAAQNKPNLLTPEQLSLKRASGAASDKAYDVTQKTVKPVAPLKPLETTSNLPNNGMNIAQSRASKTEYMTSALPSEPGAFSDGLGISKIKNTPTKSSQEPVIPAGQKERGFGKNVRTDNYMNDTIRDSVTGDPLTYEQLTNKSTLDKANARFAQGYEKALNDWNNSLSTFRVDDVPLARLIANEAAARGDIATARKVVADIAEKLTQAGQFSQAARILRQSNDPIAFVTSIERDLNKLNRDGFKRFGKDWTNVKFTNEEIEIITKAWESSDEAVREKTMEVIYDRIIKQLPVSKMDKFDAWRRIAMLLNPKTHVRNIGGNLIMSGLRKTADTIGAGLETAFMLKPGERTKSVGWSFDKKLADTVEKEWQANKTELLQEGRFDLENLSSFNREKLIFKKGLVTKLVEQLSGKAFDRGILESVNQFSKWALNAGDVPFLRRAYKDALGQFMKANKLDIATDAAKEYAKRRAFEATFKQVNWFTKKMSELKRGKAGKLVEAAMPFTKTPSNIVARSFEYSPVGFVKLLFSKGKQPAEIIETLSKGLTGSAVAGAGYLLAYMGWARAEKNKSKNAEAILQQMGEQPYSIITPQGSYTFDWAQPFAVPFAMGMTVFERLDKSDTVDLETVGDSIAAGSDTIFNLGMLQNVKELFGGGFGSVTEQIAGLPVSYVEQAFPTVAGQVARSVDSTRRNTYNPDPVKQFGNQLAARTPGISQNLEPKLDIWGKVQKQDPALAQFLSPGYWKGKSSDPVTQEIVRLYKSTKKTDMLPKVARTKFTYKGKEVELTPLQVTEYQRLMGDKNYQDISRYLSDPKSRNLSDEVKARAIAGIVNFNNDTIKLRFVQK